ncbi:MAG TPA: hypothetical protein VFU19_14610 [Iamia sp.]|nr:hypothetical protein [Iamia sp.]
MLRRRHQVREAVLGDDSFTLRWLPRLRQADWVLPASLVRDDVVPIGTALGVVDGPVTATVDPRGLVTIGPEGNGRSLDWWVGADDRWYLPAREPGVTQVRVEHAPVVETTMRVPGGEVVHRAYAARGGRYPGGDAWIVVEVENRSAVPVALAWAVRPFTPAGVTFTQTMEVEPAAGVAPGSNGPHLVTEQGDPLGMLPRPPSRWARTLDDEDVAPLVLAGEARSGPVTPVFGDDGDHPDRSTADLATMALLVPLPHTATARFLLLPQGFDPAGAWDDDGRTTFAWPGDLPAATAVARGWSSLVGDGPRIDVPDPVLADAVEAARRSLLLAHRVTTEPQVDDRRAPDVTHRITTRGGWDERPDPAGEQMEILAALARWGHHDAADRALITWPEGQQRGGGFGSVEATAAALEALAAHAVAAGDAGPARAWLPEVGGAVEWLGRRARKPKPGDDRSIMADGLDAAAVVLAALDQPTAAAAVAADATRLRPSPPVPPGSPGSAASLSPGSPSSSSPGSASSSRLSSSSVPPGSVPAPSSSSPGSASSSSPPPSSSSVPPGSVPAPSSSSVLPGSVPAPSSSSPGSASSSRPSSSSGAPVVDLDAPSVTPREVAAAAVAATRAGAEASALWALLRRASATWTWSDPERWAGDDLLVPARLLTAVGRLLVADGPTGPALTTWMPPAWWGLGWEVHGVPTRWGRVSYAVRWHSGRPALLWELGPPVEGIAGEPVLTAPGLDPAWSSTERRGEALLAAVPPPPGVEPGPEVHQGGVAVAAPPRSVWRPQDPGPDAPTDRPAAPPDRPDDPPSAPDTSFT